MSQSQSVSEWIKLLLLGKKYPDPTFELKSVRGVDYSKLKKLLARGKWEKADQETAKVMLQAANRVEEKWLDVEDIDNFPCEDLCTINQLWVHYSNGKFGFSVQAEIYRSLEGTKELGYDIFWEKFCVRVGWRKGDDSQFINAPRGYLPEGSFPACLFLMTMVQWITLGITDDLLRVINLEGGFDFQRWFISSKFTSLFSRVQTCCDYDI